MGTSQSSNGSPSGTPMVPPWTPDIPSTQQSETDVGGDIPDDSTDAGSPPSDGDVGPCTALHWGGTALTWDACYFRTAARCALVNPA